MNMVDIFIVFFVQNAEITKLKKIGLNPQLRSITNEVSASVTYSDMNHIEEQVGVGIDVFKQKDQFKA